MRIVIDENGDALEGEPTRSYTGPSTAASDSGVYAHEPVTVHFIQCPDCATNIELPPAAQIKIHECDVESLATGLPSLRLFVDASGWLLVKGSALAKEPVLSLFNKRGYRQEDKKLQFSHLATSGAVEELRRDLQGLGVAVIYEERQSGPAVCR